MEIKGILITFLVPMNDHIANGGEKILGNASSIKQRPDGRVIQKGCRQSDRQRRSVEVLIFLSPLASGGIITHAATPEDAFELPLELGDFLGHFPRWHP